MWTDNGMPGHGGRAKLVHFGKDTEAPTAEFIPCGFSASWIGMSEEESLTESQETASHKSDSVGPAGRESHKRRRLG